MILWPLVAIIGLGLGFALGAKFTARVLVRRAAQAVATTPPQPPATDPEASFTILVTKSQQNLCVILPPGTFHEYAAMVLRDAADVLHAPGLRH